MEHRRGDVTSSGARPAAPSPRGCVVAGRRVALAVLTTGLCGFCSGRNANAGVVSELSDFEVTSRSNVSVSGSCLRLRRAFGQSEQGLVCLDATLGALHFADDGDVGYDAAAGQRYAQRLTRGTYRFTVREAAELVTWYRVWFPLAGRWNHQEILDDARTRVDDSTGKDAAQTWLWIRGPVRRIASGKREFVLDGYHGGARLALIVFAPASWRPGAEAPAPTFLLGTPSGSIVYRASRPKGFRRWGSLRYVSMPGSGTVQVAARAVGADEWHPAAPGADLGPLVGDADLQLRISLAAAADRSGPVVIVGGVQYEGDAPTLLRGDAMELAFNPADGSLLRVQRRRDSRSWIDARPGTALCVPARVIDGRVEELAGRVQSMHATDEALTQELAFGDGSVAATVRVLMRGPAEAVFTAEVRNHGQTPLVYVEFPRLAGLRGGDSERDDFLLFPHLNQNFWKQPADQPVLWKTSAGHEGRAVPMRFLDLWDQAGGLYLGSHDPTFRDTGLIIGKWPGPAVCARFRKFVRILPGSAWTTPPFVLRLHDGDWHAGADTYAAWAREHVRMHEPPRWMREEFDGVEGAYGHHFGANGFTEVLDAVQHFQRIGGMTSLHCSRQGLDSERLFCGLVPHPNPTWGGPEEFAQTNELVRQFGGHAFWYVNWLLLCPNYAVSKRIGGHPRQAYPADKPYLTEAWFARNVVRTAAGDWPSVPSPDAVYAHLTLYLGSREVQDRLVDWARTYYTRYNVDGIYFDCLLDAYNINLDPAHSAGDLGQFSNGSTAALERIAAVARAASAHASFYGEGFADINFGRHAHAHAGNGRRWLQYMFPEWIQIGGHHQPASYTTPETLRANYEHMYLNGARFLNTTFALFGMKSSAALPEDYGRRVLKLRRRVKSLVYAATFRDTRGLRVRLPGGEVPAFHDAVQLPGTTQTHKGMYPTAPSLYARRFVLDHAGSSAEVLNTLNSLEEERGAGTLTLSGCSLADIRAAWLFALDEPLRPLPWSRNGTEVELAFPQARLATIVLVDRVQPLLYPAIPSYTARGTSVAVTVDVLNLNAAPLSGQITVDGPDGVDAAPVHFHGLAPGESQTVALTVTFPNSLPYGRTDLDIVATAEGHPPARRLCWTYVGRPLRASIRQSIRTEGVDITLENFSDRTVRGYCRALEDAWFRGVAQPGGDPFATPSARCPFVVQAGAKHTATVPLEHKQPLELPQLARVEVSYAEHTQALVKSIRPSIPNGDFEIDLVGSGNPDGWNSHRGSYGSYVLDTQVKFTGARALRLAPLPAKQVNVVTNLSQAVRPGRYRLQAAVRREECSREVQIRADVLVGSHRQTFYLGATTTAGTWELFEQELVVPAPDPQDTGRQWGLGTMPALAIALVNGSKGNAWFDSICLERDEDDE